MASRLLLRSSFSTLFRPATATSPLSPLNRTFHTTPRLLDTAPLTPVRRPVGAFRGGIFGFLLGSTLSGAAVYYYILEEYRVSNELLTEDIYALQAAVHRIEGYVKALDDRITEQARTKG